MVPPSAGSVVLIPFPFSDLSQSKLRPAVVLAPAGNEDFILAQITSNTYADQTAVELNETDFLEGSLRRRSYVRPGKLFTAHQSLIVSQVAVINLISSVQLLNQLLPYFVATYKDNSFFEFSFW